MNIILLGAPGSGKDTLANQLQSEYNFTILSPGQIFRDEAEKGTELGLWAKEKYWSNGLLCPDDVTNTLMKIAYEELTDDEQNVIIFNGYPRTLSQAKSISFPIDLVLCLDVNYATAMRRLLSRGREDDTEEVIKERLKVFRANEKKIRSVFYDTGVPVIDIDANSTISRVFEFSFKNILNFKY